MRLIELPDTSTLIDGTAASSDLSTLSYGPAVTLLGGDRPYYYCFHVSSGLLFQPFPDDNEVLHPRS
jgi:hypothetical protein